MLHYCFVRIWSQVITCDPFPENLNFVMHYCIISLHMLSEQMTHFLTLQIWREINESNCKESFFISLKFMISSCLKDKFLSYKLQ